MMRMFHEPRRASGLAETTGATAEIACARRSPQGVQSTANWLKASPQGGFARLGKAINITEDVRKYAAELGIAEEEALAKGMAEKAEEYRRAGAGGIDSLQASPEGEDAGKRSNQFVEKGAEVYAKA